MLAQTLRWIFLLAGFLCLALATAGIILPVLPTTPFVLLAAWCFSRGSKRLHRWLLENPTFGPSIQAWEEHRVIPLRIKILASSIMVPLTVYMQLASPAPIWAKIAAGALVSWGLIYIWTKPSQPKTRLRTSCRNTDPTIDTIPPEHADPVIEETEP